MKYVIPLTEESNSKLLCKIGEIRERLERVIR